MRDKSVQPYPGDDIDSHPFTADKTTRHGEPGEYLHPLDGYETLNVYEINYYLCE